MIPVTLRHISKLYGSTRAVESLDLDIDPGELFFLLGPSGCGKTTLLRIIAGLLPPTTGSVFFGHDNVTHLPTGKRQTALVFQSYALWPHMTVEQNVAFGLDVRGVSSREKRQRVSEALELVRMSDLASRHPAQLSGGQQQRVALARALVVRPRVLLLDEPLSNLDAKLRMEMRSEIRRICKSANITTIYVTHDQSEALSMADRIALMQDGRLCQVGAPSQIYNRPANRFAAGFLGSTNFVPAVVREVEDRRVQLETPIGLVWSSVFPSGISADDKVTCSIRPEAIRLLSAGQSTDNAVAASHVQTIYLGDAAQHTFRLEDGLSLELTEPKPVPRQWSDTPVRIGFDAGDVVVLAQ